MHLNSTEVVSAKDQVSIFLRYVGCGSLLKENKVVLLDAVQSTNRWEYKKGSLTDPCNYKPIFATLNIQSYRKICSQSNKYLSEFEKFIIHFPIWFSEKALYRFLSLLFEWQNFLFKFLIWRNLKTIWRLAWF